MLDIFVNPRLSWVKKRAKKDFQDLVLNSQSQNKKLAIVSVDMQINYIRGINPKKKQEILVYYHRLIKDLCSKNSIPFIEIYYNSRGEHTLPLITENSVFFNKKTLAIDNVDFFSYLENLEVEMLYVIGLNRNACLLMSIEKLIKKKYLVFTSILGSASENIFPRVSNKYLRENPEELLELKKSLNLSFLKFYSDNNIDILDSIGDIKALRNMGANIIDYNSKD